MYILGINTLAVLSAALLNIIIAIIWYSKMLFGKAWTKEATTSDENIKTKKAVKYLGAFLCSLIISLSAAFLLKHLAYINPLLGALKLSILVSLGIFGMMYMMISLFENISFKLYLINTSYHALSFCISCFIIAYWG